MLCLYNVRTGRPPLQRHRREMLAASCRKKVVKGMAGHVLKAAQDEWAHLVLMCALSVVDDTALLSKVILAELRVSASALYWPLPMRWAVLGLKYGGPACAYASKKHNGPVLPSWRPQKAGSTHTC